MTNISDSSATTNVEVKTKVISLLLVAPLCSILLVAVLYLMLNPMIPDHVAIHMGSDGAGFGSTSIMIAITCAVAAAVFASGGFTAKGYMKYDHWFQKEKLISVSIVAVGYGIVGVALATIFSTIGVEATEISGDSVAMGMLGFLFMFVASISVYILLLPRGQMETL